MLIEIKKNTGIALYITLWGVAFVIIAFIIVTGYREKLPETNFFKGNILDNRSSSGEVINELLLSANELTIAEKKSFIHLYLKSADIVSSDIYTKNKEEQRQIYNQIFQRKINKLNNKSSNEDFSIKPIPK